MSETALAPRPQAAITQEAREDVEFVAFGGLDKIKLNVTIVQNLCANPTKSGQLPTRQDAIRFMMLCRAQRLNPFAGDAFLIGYDSKDGPKFSLITAHQAFLKRAEVHPEFDGMSSGIIIAPASDCLACNTTGLITDNGRPSVCPLCGGRGKRDEIEGDFIPEETTLVGAWAHVKLKNRSLSTHRRISLAATRPQFASHIWDKNPAMMLVKTAEADALRSTFPTLLGGLYTAEEGVDLLGRNQDIAHSGDLAKMVSEGPKAPTRRIAAPPAPKATASPRNRPTLVEEPLNPDEAEEAAAGLAPQPPAPAPATESPKMSVQDQLGKIVTEAGFSFDQFCAYAISVLGDGDKSTGILAWDTYAGFDDVPEKVASLCVRTSARMIETMKAGAS